MTLLAIVLYAMARPHTISFRCLRRGTALISVPRSTLAFLMWFPVLSKITLVAPAQYVSIATKLLAKYQRLELKGGRFLTPPFVY